MITSSANPRVKQIVQWQTKAKERRKDGIFLAEGLKMFEEAPLERIVEVYVSKDAIYATRSFSEQQKDKEGYMLSTSMTEISTR